MRVHHLLLGVAALSAIGGSCVPLIDLDAPQNEPPPATQLAASVTRPQSDRTVASGSIVAIDWTAANLTGSEAIATLLVRKREDRSETILAGGVVVTDVGIHQNFDWDTTGFEGGLYNVVVRINAGNESDEEIGPGIITISLPPELTFTEPFEDTTLENDDPDSDADPTVRIRWSGSDADGDGKVEIGVDLDLDHETGNEIVIVAEKDLASDAAFDSFEWDGNDVDGARVDAGTYLIYARISDIPNGESFVDGLARIIVPEGPDDDATNAVTEPEEDRQFLATETTTNIKYTVGEPDDVLIDLKIDTDDNHQNGNEITILSQRLVEADTSSGEFDWNGQDSTGAVVADNIYRVFMLINRGSGTPATEEAEGLVFRRSEENKPLIGLLAPAAEQTVTAGQFLTIQWRDDDPSETGKVFLRVDDDANPQEAVETGAAEIEILANREAKGDDVQDSFAWQVLSSLTPGTYFIFAYVDRDGAAPFEHSNVAAGRLIIRDPTMP